MRCKITPCDRIVAIAGNPNVGKSTVFNALTGMNQHTGNWPGKTVSNAEGVCDTEAHRYRLVDIPGTYSLMAHSAEEEVARNFLCFGEADAVVVVCDATCLERNLNLVLQTLEITDRVLVCVNLLDEAERKKIQVDPEALSDALGVSVVGVVAQKKKTLRNLTDALDRMVDGEKGAGYQVQYDPLLEQAIGLVAPTLERFSERIRARWLALRLLEEDPALLAELQRYLGEDPTEDPAVCSALQSARELLAEQGVEAQKDRIVGALLRSAEEIAGKAVRAEASGYHPFDRKVDAILTHRVMAYPLMLLLLAGVFWLTIVGANYPSEALSNGLFWVQERLTELFAYLHAPQWLHGALVLGIYRVLAWVVSVMLPPMAIFFPLFTLLEDAGFLPRIAYNLDRPFHRCHACGKQALTMCMGFGCNAAGITGCRIIDSPRERLIAILTNNFVPCNGRFPTLIALITMFFVGVSGKGGSFLSAVLLMGVILLGIGMTFGVSYLLSKTLLRGKASSFTLELPPYRKPQVGKVLVRSVFDRTLFVLGRAVAVAAPAGLILWLMANVTVADETLLHHCAQLLDPLGRLLGMDGIILIAFILGFPANEIVLPIIMMGYLAQGSLTELLSLEEMRQLLIANGWTWQTAVSTILFSLMHWPCSTALWTVKKETGSWKWTAMAAIIPTLCGAAFCLLFTALMRWCS